MNEAHEQKLFADFPQLYRDREHGLMHQGFAVGDGWFELIYTLSAAIEEAAGAAGLDPAANEWPRATQVKEKFGTLRFYVRTAGANDLVQGDVEMPAGFMEFRPVSNIPVIRALIAEAEAKSVLICENCGLPHQLKDCSHG